MILRLAYRNIVANGWRSITNMLVLSVVLIIVVWMQAMYFSWIRLAETQQTDWEYAKGMLRVRSYDPADPFSWEDSHAPISAEMQASVQRGELMPVLLSPASIYPQGRMMSGMLKGIPHDQHLVKLPAQILDPKGRDIIPVLLGSGMARSTRLNEGDVFSIRVKDANGTFNAVDAIVEAVIEIPAVTADIGSIWMDLRALRDLKAMNAEASYLVMAELGLKTLENSEFEYIDKNEYFADLYQMLKNERFQQVLMYGLLLLLAMLAVFDTQALAVFKRRREIGTLAALGFTRAKISMLFTVEGSLYMLFAGGLSAVLGFPLFWYFARFGFTLPAGYDDYGIQGFSEPIRFVYPIGEILAIYGLILLLTIWVSWIPTRKIATMNPVDALRGKVN